MVKNMPNYGQWNREQLPTKPTHLIIANSGGKDSQFMTELVVAQFKDVCPIVIHHQYLPENWEGTAELVVAQANRLGVPVVIEQPHYTRFKCSNCGHDGLIASARLEPKAGGEQLVPSCTKCRSNNITIIGEVTGLHNLMSWRKRWFSPSIRACTSYLKEAVLDSWCSRHRSELGDNPYIVMGERWAESANRKKLAYVEPRGSKKWINVWHPILHLSRREVFRGIRELDLVPHYCYALQWRSQGLSDTEIEWEMYESDTEKGGPRCSCIDCFYAIKYMGSNLKLEQNAHHLEWHQEFAATYHHDPQQGLSLAMVLAGETKPARPATETASAPVVINRLKKTACKGSKPGTAFELYQSQMSF